MKKVLISLIAVVVVGISVGAGFLIAKQSVYKEAQPNDSDFSSQALTNGMPEYEDDTEDVTSSSAHTDSNTSQEELLLGEWRDNANFSGYEFFDNGTMKVMYFNMASINLENIVDGTFSGTYKVDGDRLEISYTMYSKSNTEKYTFKVENNTLVLKKGTDEAVYVRRGTESLAMENLDPNLLGKWSSNLSGFEFKENGVVSITYINLESLGINLPISGTVDGVYSISGDELKIKYSIYTGVIDKTYSYSIEKDTLVLTEKGTGEKGIYARND